jgi:unsaturated chondroitin disaccharide hydrolase
MKINNKLHCFKAITFCAMALTISSCSTQLNNKKVLSHAQKQTDLMLTEVPKANNKNGTLVTPRTVEKDNLILVAARDWTSGFFPGSMWYLYELTKNVKWKTEAEKFTALVEDEKFNGRTHDMGFKIYCSFGNGYRLTNNQAYKDVIIQSAKTLITRFIR